MSTDIEEYSEGERKARKLFQNYFTTLLYSKPSIKVLDNGEVKKYDVGDRINSLLKTTSKMIWERLMDRHFTEFDTNETNKQFYVKKKWDNFCRFYLKGGKSTLEFVKSVAYSTNDENKESSLELLPSNEHRGNIAKAFYHELNSKTDDSDFDFCFVIHPDMLDNSNYIRYNRPISKIMKEIPYEINANVRKIIPDFLELLNDTFNQKTILMPLLRESYDYFTPEEKVIFKEVLKYYDSFELGVITEPYFKFKEKENKFFNIIEYSEKKVTLPTDTFYLHRLIIPIEFVDKKFNFPTTEGKLFAECIDISFSKDKEVSEKLWKYTDLNNILRPVYGIDDNPVFNYPIVGLEYQPQGLEYQPQGLEYQLNDIVVILSENEPNKPQKRCKRLIEQLYFSCMEEKLPQLPSLIHIGKKVYELMQEEGECKALNDILTFKKSIKIKEDEVYLFELNENIRDIEKFEMWCRNSLYKDKINLSWESQCNIDFVHKEELRRRIINICRDEFNIEVKEEFRNFEKMYVCSLYKNLVLIVAILNMWEGHRNIHLEEALDRNWNTEDDIKALISNYPINNLKERLKKYIKYYVDKNHMEVYYSGERVHTLTGYIKRFAREDTLELNSFLNVVSKFSLK